MAKVPSLPKTVEFKLYAPNAKKVILTGSFDKWSTKTSTAKKDSRGNWTIKKTLRPGRYEYKFFVDGNWADDPSCSSRITNSFGSQNCIIDIK